MIISSMSGYYTLHGPKLSVNLTTVPVDMEELKEMHKNLYQDVLNFKNLQF